MVGEWDGLFGMRTWGDGRRVGWAGWAEGLGDGVGGIGWTFWDEDLG